MRERKRERGDAMLGGFRECHAISPQNQQIAFIFPHNPLTHLLGVYFSNSLAFLLISGRGNGGMKKKTKTIKWVEEGVGVFNMQIPWSSALLCDGSSIITHPPLRCHWLEMITPSLTCHHSLALTLSLAFAFALSHFRSLALSYIYIYTLERRWSSFK